jgi:hypothetical protein
VGAEAGAFGAAGIESESATAEIGWMGEVAGTDATVTTEAVVETGRGTTADVRAVTRREVAAATTHEKASTSSESMIVVGAGGKVEESTAAASVCLRRSAENKRGKKRN